MSMPMICAAALRASSAVFASLMPPALPRPPTGTCALTATGPSLANAATASSGVRATMPGGIGMPREASTSLAWYSRSFKCLRRGRVEWAWRGGVLRIVPPGVAEALLEAGVVDQDDAADHEHQDHHETKTAPDQDGGQGDASATRGGLLAKRPPRAAVPVLQAVVGNPSTLGVLLRHGLSVLAKREAPVVAPHPASRRILEVALTAQLEIELAADCIRWAIADCRKGVHHAVPPHRPSRPNEQLHGLRRDLTPLKLRHHTPPGLVNIFVVPLSQKPTPPAASPSTITLNIRAFGWVAATYRCIRRASCSGVSEPPICSVISGALSRTSSGMSASPHGSSWITTEGCCRATSAIVCAPCASRCARLGSAHCASGPARSRRRYNRAPRRCRGWR